VGLVRDLLLHGLALDGPLCSVRVRRVPVRPALEPRGDEQPHAPAFTKKDLTLVNPVAQSIAAGQRLFLLDASELGQLRFLMARFRYFRLCPSERSLEPSVDVLAELEAGPATAQEPGGAETQLEAELGGLRRLHAGHGPPLWPGDFEAWLQLLLPRYIAMLASWG